MEKEEYAKSFWSDMQKFNVAKIEKAKVDEIISLLESAVTCKFWYSCESCKGVKKSIALIKNMENHEREQHTGN